MRDAEANGCRASSIVRVRRCGKLWNAETLKPIWKARFFYVQSLSSEISPKQWIRGLSRALQALRKYSRVLRHRRAPADCFGANPVASALGDPPGATPAGLCEHTMGVEPRPSKPELSTWLGIGTFYLAPTLFSAEVSPPSEKFLFQPSRTFLLTP